MASSESVVGRPAAALREYFADYVGYRQAGGGPAEHAGLPSPNLTLIITLDEPLTVARHADLRQPPGEYLTLVGGLHSRPALITHDGRQSGIQLGLSPLGARAILGVPAGELAQIDVPGSDVLGGLADEIHERVRQAGTWPERFAILDELLLRRLDGTSSQPVGPEVGFAWRRLIQTGGTIGVAALADETGWSDRHLRTRFAAEIGLTPKTAARVVRFDRARRMLQRRAVSGATAAGLDLAGLAACCGYYDQAHMDAEFGQFAGSAPTRWLAREFRIFQASAVA